MYLKLLSQLYMKKNLTAEALANETKKSEERFHDNEVIALFKPNIELLISGVQEKERTGKEIMAM